MKKKSEEKINSPQEHTFYVHGMHCSSCVVLTQNELSDIPNVQTVVADLDTRSVTVVGDFDNRSEEEIANQLNAPMKKHGYTISTDPEIKENRRLKDFTIALPVALIVILFFLFLQKIGIVNVVNTESVTYSTTFFIGVIASLSTCMAVVGGLVLSISASYSKNDAGITPPLLFHAGRLIAFFILGGIIGVAGSFIDISGVTTTILSIFITLVLLVLGIGLLDIFPWAQKLQPTLPSWLSTRMLGIKKFNTVITPALIGAITFFLPCGFTQSMQLYTLTTGSFLEGGLTMLFFALGTFPVLALLSFSSVGIKTPAARSIFFKTAGCVVIFFAVLQLWTIFSTTR